MLVHAPEGLKLVTIGDPSSLLGKLISSPPSEGILVATSNFNRNSVVSPATFESG